MVIPTLKRLFAVGLSIAFASGVKVSVMIEESMRLIPHTGITRSLILRITDSLGDQPDNDASKISDLIFGTHKLTLTGNLNIMVSILVSYFVTMT